LGFLFFLLWWFFLTKKPVGFLVFMGFSVWGCVWGCSPALALLRFFRCSVPHACVLVQGASVCAVCGRLVHLGVMCAEACGGVLQTVWRGLAFGLETYRRGVGFLLHVDEATRCKRAVVLSG
jgi:hypothetical protein